MASPELVLETDHAARARQCFCMRCLTNKSIHRKANLNNFGFTKLEIGLQMILAVISLRQQLFVCLFGILLGP